RVSFDAGHARGRLPDRRRERRGFVATRVKQLLIPIHTGHGTAHRPVADPRFLVLAGRYGGETPCEIPRPGLEARKDGHGTLGGGGDRGSLRRVDDDVAVGQPKQCETVAAGGWWERGGVERLAIE